MLWMWRHRSSLSDVPQASGQRGGASRPTTQSTRNCRSSQHIDTPTLSENATYVIMSNNAENPVDHTPLNMDAPRHEDDTCIEDTDPQQTVKPESHRIHSDVNSETRHQQQQQTKTNGTRHGYHNGGCITQCNNYMRE